jgi:hypothetical protein
MSNNEQEKNEQEKNNEQEKDIVELQPDETKEVVGGAAAPAPAPAPTAPAVPMHPDDQHKMHERRDYYGR